MSIEQWTSVDRYVEDALIPPDPALDKVLEASAAAGLPAIQVSASQGKLLYLLSRIRGATSILELGTLGGYSTIWLARALPPGGRLITLEVDPKHAAVAKENLRRAELADRVEVQVGKALELLPELKRQGVGPFDLVFIDADKQNLAEYFQWALELSAKGTVIVVDNVVRKGAVLDAQSADLSVQGVRRLNDKLKQLSRVRATTIQTVGSKGYDGFTLALVD